MQPSGNSAPPARRSLAGPAAPPRPSRRRDGQAGGSGQAGAPARPAMPAISTASAASAGPGGTSGTRGRADPTPGKNGRGELSRNIELTLKRADFERAAGFSSASRSRTIRAGIHDSVRDLPVESKDAASLESSSCAEHRAQRKRIDSGSALSAPPTGTVSSIPGRAVTATPSAAAGVPLLWPPFTSYEQIEDIPLHGGQADGSREEFSRKKLLGGPAQGLREAAGGVEEAGGDRRADENLLLRAEDREISTHDIGGFVMERLRELDQVPTSASPRSNRRFEDIDAFMDVLKRSSTRKRLREHGGKYASMFLVSRFQSELEAAVPGGPGGGREQPAGDRVAGRPSTSSRRLGRSSSSPRCRE